MPRPPGVPAPLSQMGTGASTSVRFLDTIVLEGAGMLGPRGGTAVASLGCACNGKGSVVRIVLVDWSEIFRMGLRALLAEARDVAVVGEAADLGTALEVVRAQAPDLVVTDLDLADGTGLALALAIRDVAPTTRVVLL